MGSPIFTRRGLAGQSTRLPWRRRACLPLTILAAGVLLPPAAPGVAQQAFGRADDPWTKLTRLEARADALAERYRGRLVKLDEVKRDAERASARAHRLDRESVKAHARLAELAAMEYKIGPVNPTLQMLFGGDPEDALSKVATVEYLARADKQQVRQLRSSLLTARRARGAARTRAAKLQQAIDDLAGKRDEIDRLIAHYESQLPTAPGGITPRMATVYRQVVERFGAPYGVGCYRPGSSGEHPLGRACDFMLSSGGVMPSGTQVRRGYAIADWAVANAGRLGIMYVIYRQRIWDIRTGDGWQGMEDRGSITANHFDHVHISVF